MKKFWKKYKKNYVILTLIGIFIFVISYTFSIRIIKDKELFGESIFEKTQETLNFKMSDTVFSENTKVKFYLKYNNCLDSIEANESLDKGIRAEKNKLIGLSGQELESIFSNFGYKLDRLTKEEAVFTKNINVYDYDTDSYFIGIKGDYVVIYKKENSSSIRVVEDGVINPKSENSSRITIKDIENRGNFLKTLYEGNKDYQFSNIQDAVEYAKALCST